MKRRGFSAWSVAAPADILRLAALDLSGGATYLLAHCTDGHVYQTQDGGSWTSIDSGLSTTAGFGWVQYMDKVYYCDGSTAMRSWDATTTTLLPTTDQNDVQTVTITGTPTSGTFTLTFHAADGTSQTTMGIAFNADAPTVQAALVGLTSIGAGQIVCTGGALPGTGVVCTFTGLLAARPITLMTTSGASLGGGTSPASHVAHTTTGFASVPTGNLLTVWRNRLWVSGVPATPRRVFWSVINDPTSFINKLNWVDFPGDTEIIALHAGPNVGLGSAGADGVLVFCRNRFHRIYDDSDNVGIVASGGANLLVDESRGAIGPYVVAPAEGNLWFASEHGWHSTDGHGITDEATRVLPLLRTFAWASTDQFVAFHLNGRYYFAYTPVGQASNTRLLEAYADLFRIGWVRRRGGQHQWMAHDVPIASAVVVDTAEGQVCYFADASPGDGAYVRRLFNGGSDADGLTGTLDITAFAKTGSQTFGSPKPKRVRRVELYGRGSVNVAISSDLETGQGESQLFDMHSPSDTKWGNFKWGRAKWSAGAGPQRQARYYSQRGRYLTFTLTETSQDTTTADRVLGYAGPQSGGAAVYSALVKLVPLDAD